ncbi:MAG: DNA recombination protein RmuC [Candidatus Omnitrophica bacterium]|nr:DNA recombination protein RmuC [Candidatus Omnitrophota bacterium]
MGIILFITGFIAGGLIVWFLVSIFIQRQIIEREGKIKSAESIATELRTQLQQKDNELNNLRSALTSEQQIRIGVETRLEETKKNLEEQKQLLAEAKQELINTFKALSSDALKDSNQVFLNLAKQTLENLLTEAKGDLGKRQQAIEEVIKPLKESLNNFELQIRELEKSRADAYGGLKQYLERLTQINQQLQKETTNLVTALKRPVVRGRWGEITLRRVVEVAGMSQYCDFVEQPSADTEEGRRRPDLIVKLPGERLVVVDAKAPLDAYMSAIETEDEDSRKVYLLQHAQAVREHMRLLSAKVYWNQFSPTPDFVVLFLPGESFFSAALEQDRNLIEDGIANRVILATPTTLIALLRTVAFTWQQQQLTENAYRIAAAGTELFDRVCKFAEHLNGIRNGLEKAIESYNAAIGAWEHRVLPAARKLKELGAGATEQEPQDIEQIDKSLRKIPDLKEENKS